MNQRQNAVYKKILLGLSLPIAGIALANPSLASSLEKDAASLEGEWQGQAMDGTPVRMTFAGGHGNVLLTGSWKIGGGSFAGEAELSLVRAGNLYFLVPDAAPFVPGKEPYSLLRLPGGGLRFVRLTHVEVGNQQGIQAEEVLIGKKRGDGTRLVRLLSSEKLCADPAVPAGKACGDAVSEQIALHKMTP